jgi:hypothetical protein
MVPISPCREAAGRQPSTARVVMPSPSGMAPHDSIGRVLTVALRGVDYGRSCPKASRFPWMQIMPVGMGQLTWPLNFQRLQSNDYPFDSAPPNDRYETARPLRSSRPGTASCRKNGENGPDSTPRGARIAI